MGDGTAIYLFSFCGKKNKMQKLINMNVAFMVFRLAIKNFKRF
jgi:hypothetical protein